MKYHWSARLCHSDIGLSLVELYLIAQIIIIYSRCVLACLLPCHMDTFPFGKIVSILGVVNILEIQIPFVVKPDRKSVV